MISPFYFLTYNIVFSEYSQIATKLSLIFVRNYLGTLNWKQWNVIGISVYLSICVTVATSSLLKKFQNKPIHIIKNSPQLCFECLKNGRTTVIYVSIIGLTCTILYSLPLISQTFTLYIFYVKKLWYHKYSVLVLKLQY